MNKKFHIWRRKVRAFQRYYKVPPFSNEHLFIAWSKMNNLQKITWCYEVDYITREHMKRGEELLIPLRFYSFGVDV